MHKGVPWLSYLLLMLLLGCGKQPPPGVMLSDLEERLVKEPLTPVADSLFIMKDSSLLYLMDFRRDAPEDTRFLLHALVARDSFINLDFDKKNFRAKPGRIPGWPEFMLWSVPLPPTATGRYRIGEYKRGPNQEAIKYWQQSLNLENSFKEGLQECWDRSGPEPLNTTTLALDFQLEQGKYLQLPHGYYLLLYNQQCWVFKPKNTDKNTKVLIHFVNDDGSFDNYSHSKSPQSYPSCFPSFADYEVTRITLAKSFQDYNKLRFGEFSASGNQWVQSYRIRTIVQNELLVYGNELKGTSNP